MYNSRRNYKTSFPTNTRLHICTVSHFLFLSRCFFPLSSAFLFSLLFVYAVQGDPRITRRPSANSENDLTRGREGAAADVSSVGRYRLAKQDEHSRLGATIGFATESVAGPLFPGTGPSARPSSSPRRALNGCRHPTEQVRIHSG